MWRIYRVSLWHAKASGSGFFMVFASFRSTLNREFGMMMYDRRGHHASADKPGVKRMDTKTKPLIVVAVGGNAILREHERGTIAEQTANVEACADELVSVFDAGYQLVLTHGNGPQVGLILVRDS
jgi:photosystem II stability/assembly factor-like uncharacterized protein